MQGIAQKILANPAKYSIEQLTQGVQNGVIPAYVGIPLIQEKIQQQKEAQSMSMGQQQRRPVAEQIMQEAQSAGVPALSSNLPQEYAGGGIIAFDEGGEVKRYSGVGPSLTSSVPPLSYEQLSRLYATDPKLAREAALRAGPVGQRILAGIEAAARVGAVPAAVGAGGAAASEFAAGVTGAMSPEQRKAISSNPMLSAMSGDTGLAAAIQNAPNMEKPTMGSGDQILNALSFFPKTLIGAPGDANSPKGYGLTRLLNSDSAPAAASITETPYDPTTATRRSMYPEQTQPSTAPASPVAPVAPVDPGIASIKMPTLQTYTPKVATLPERTMGDLVDLDAITKDMPEKTKTAFDTAVNATKTELEGFDKPGFDTREGRLKQREAGLEKDSAIGRALNLMSLGFGIAGSKERTLAGALGNEGRQGIADLIRGEAANRAAKDRLEDARDNFEQQKVAAKKGNYQAAQAAGRDASRDLLAATQFSLTGAQAGNAQAINMFSALSQRDIGAANVTNQGEQIRAAAIDSANRSALGLTGLNLQQQQLAQTGAFQNKQLEAMEKRYAAMDNASRARILQVRAGAMAKFMENTAPQLNAQFVKEYGPNWRTGGDTRSLEAQMKFKQAQNAYIMDALGQYETMKDARSADDLLSQ
jgi:hypothetical protein